MKKALSLFLLLILSACQKVDDRLPIIVVSDSYIESSILDLLAGPVQIVRLAEPGLCPAHTEIKPSHVEKISRARAVFIFDFQKDFQNLITRQLGKNESLLSIVKSPPGLSIPNSYLDVCKQVGTSLISSRLLSQENFNHKLSAIESRIKALEKSQLQLSKFKSIAGTNVISSIHQKEFCKYLGLNVVATFSESDFAKFSSLNSVIKTGKDFDVKIIIANKQEGTRAASAIAERLNAKIIILSNFPEKSFKNRSAFDDLFLSNISSLIHNLTNE
jgi:ABC-type Zn uptake system ZnuABC Zn-binding protein ZnuA